MSDARLAAEIAQEAGRLLLAIRAEGRETDPALGKRGDAEANRLILARLAADRPGDAVLSEESVDDPARCAASRVWIIDPLDGTREYAEGRGDWAVHVALAIDGQPAVGAVALPVSGELFATDPAPPTPAAGAQLRFTVSRTRPPAVAVRAAEALGATLVPIGSAGAKAMAVVRGDVDAYLHTGGQHQWDSCAPVAVALAAGLHASRIDGTPLVYNAADSYLPDLLICRQELVQPIARALRESS